MHYLRIIAHYLYVRSTPAKESNNLSGPALTHGQIVEKLSVSEDGGWYFVRIGQGSQPRLGWISSKPEYVEPIEDDNESPSWYYYARQESGQAGVPGPGANPRVVEFLRSTDGGADASNDETFWCSAFVNWVMIQAGYEGTNSLAARSWWKWNGGTREDNPRLGSIVVFKRFDQGTWDVFGHVGFFVRRDGDDIFVLGGNQGNAVNISSYPADGATHKLLGYLWPKPLQ